MAVFLFLVLLLVFCQLCLNDDVEKKNSGISLIAKALIVLVIFVFIWMIVQIITFGRSYNSLNKPSEVLTRQGAELTNYLFETGGGDGIVGTEGFRGIVIGKVGCLLVWDGARFKCFTLDNDTDAMIYLYPERASFDMSRITKLEHRGLVSLKQISITNEGDTDVFVSEVNALSINQLIRLIRFGDIVRVVKNVDNGAIINVVLVYRGGLI